MRPRIKREGQHAPDERRAPDCESWGRCCCVPCMDPSRHCPVAPTPPCVPNPPASVCSITRGLLLGPCAPGGGLEIAGGGLEIADHTPHVADSRRRRRLRLLRSPISEMSPRHAEARRVSKCLTPLRASTGRARKTRSREMTHGCGQGRLGTSTPPNDPRPHVRHLHCSHVHGQPRALFTFSWSATSRGGASLCREWRASPRQRRGT